MKKRLIWMLLIGFFVVSCQPPATQISETGDKPFFDLKAFFEKEIEQKGETLSATKTTEVDGKVESQKIDDLDFRKELQSFIESDINRMAWTDKYEVDSLFAQQVLIGLDYQAKEEGMTIKSINISFEKEQVTKIVIKKSAKTALADTAAELVYQPTIGYSITNSQVLTVGDDKEFKVAVNF